MLSLTNVIFANIYCAATVNIPIFLNYSQRETQTPKVYIELV